MTKFLTILLSKYKLLPVFICLFLSACGGTSANGVGGTGITQGRVTGFGSMFVNGVKFNTDNATFIRDGVSSKKQEDFNTGEIVTVKGTVDSGRKTGVATEVTFSDVLEGTITSVPTANSVGILGQSVETNNLTVFHGFNKLSDLQLGNIVEISGFTFQNKITASSIQLIESSFTDSSSLEIKGDISSLNRDSFTFEINDLVVDYSTATFAGITQEAINNGDYLIISSNQDIENNILTATSISTINNSLMANTYYEIEGFVTEFNSVTNFTIEDDSLITTDTNTVISNGSLSDLKLNQLIIAIGTTNDNGVLVTEEIRILNSSDSISIEANIESIDLEDNSLIILDRKINIDSFTLLSDETTEDFVLFNLNEFAVGDSVFLDASLSDGEYIANRLSKIPTITTEFIIGTVDIIDVEQNQFVVANSNISTDDSTVYINENDEIITKSSFFSRLEVGVTKVGIETNYVANQEIIATELTIF